MKKFLLAIAVAMSMGMMASCEDDVDLTEGSYDNNPAATVAGTYSGTWTVTNVKTSATTTASGTTTIAKEDGSSTNFVARLTAAIEGTELVSGTLTDNELVNIVRTSQGTDFQNLLGTEIGDKLNGNISTDGIMTCSFQRTVGKGAKAATTLYSFTGTK